ncbi:MAG TPA: hypothetical protein GX504_06230 [Clostridia bacterium]|nr:hypothetical protein [Clostridia bacterium]
MQTFVSPTRGPLDFEGMYQDILSFIGARPFGAFKLIVGTDSQVKDETCFVTAIVVHHVGKGARYYYTKSYLRRMDSLRQRIFYETSMSLDIASRLAARLSQDGLEGLDAEIHLDVGPNGETKELIREIVGMVTGNGFEAVIKPDSTGASKVADKYTK